MKKSAIALALCSGLLAGCSPQTPMEKLQSNTVYAELNDAFWNKEMRAHTPLWKEAKAYCQKNADKPNCPVVSNQMFFDGISMNVPKYGSSGHYLHTPDF